MAYSGGMNGRTYRGKQFQTNLQAFSTVGSVLLGGFAGSGKTCAVLNELQQWYRQGEEEPVVHIIDGYRIAPIEERTSLV